MKKIFISILIFLFIAFIIWWFYILRHDIFQTYNNTNLQIFILLYALIPAITTALGAGVIYASSGLRNIYIEKKESEEFNKGMEFYKIKKYSQAIQIWKPLAEKGYIEAQYYFGEVHALGQAVMQNDEKAIEWYRKAARAEWYQILGKKGHAQAQNNLGYMYQEAEGVDEDYKKAIKYYRKAAKQGNLSAQNNLGFIYKEGLSVKADNEKAFGWHKKAADQGHAPAQNNVGYMYDKGLFGGKSNPKEAVKWYKQSARQGDEAGQGNLGSMYEEGDGVKADKVQAYKWFYIAKENDGKGAQKRLNKLKKKMSKKQIEDAEALAKKCIESNYENCGDPQE